MTSTKSLVLTNSAQIPMLLLTTLLLTASFLKSSKTYLKRLTLIRSKTLKKTYKNFRRYKVHSHKKIKKY